MGIPLQQAHSAPLSSPTFYSLAQGHAGKNKRKAAGDAGAVEVIDADDDLSEQPTMKKSQKSQSSQSRNPASDFSMPAPQGEASRSGAGQDSHLEAHAQLAEAGGFVRIEGEEGGSGNGLFHYLGGGKSAVKSGFVTVTASGYDPSKKRPDDLVAGRKGGQGVEALVGDDGQTWVEFSLRRDIEFAPTAYSLRNGSRDMGQFPKNWCLECFVGSRWVTFGEEDTDALDGCKQSLERFQVSEQYASSSDIFVQRMRIRHLGDAESERHKLWFASVELYGALRTADY